MGATSAVTIDAFRGEARLGRTIVPVAVAGVRGELRVGGAEGPTLRPLTFGERDRAAALAAMSSDAREELSAAIVAAATVRLGTGDPVVHEIVALVLAGAGIEDAPAFCECALRIAQATGWDYRQVADSEAANIDRLALSLHRSESEARWNRLAFAEDPAEELDSIRAELIDNLLRRAQIAPAALSETIDSRMPEENGVKSSVLKSGDLPPTELSQTAMPKTPRQPIKTRANADPGAWPFRIKVAATQPVPVSQKSCESLNRREIESHGSAPESRLQVSVGSPRKSILPSRSRDHSSAASPAGAASLPFTPTSFSSGHERHHAQFLPETELVAPLNMTAFSDGLTSEEPVPTEPEIELADALADALHAEADLRGLDR